MMVLGAAIIEQRMRQHRQMMLGTRGNRNPDLSQMVGRAVLLRHSPVSAPHFELFRLAYLHGLEARVGGVHIPQHESGRRERKGNKAGEAGGAIAGKRSRSALRADETREEVMHAFTRSGLDEVVLSSREEA